MLCTNLVMAVLAMDAADVVDLEWMDGPVLVALVFGLVHLDGCWMYRAYSSPNYVAASFDGC